MVMRVLVTGSSGTVGTGLCQGLLAESYSLAAIDRKPNLWDKAIESRTIKHDLRRPLTKMVKKRPDLIVHLAANARVHDSVIDPGLAHDNYLMLYNVLEYARLAGVKRLLFSSSREVYGESKAGKKRSEQNFDLASVKSPYTATKAGGEALIHAYSECYGIKSVIVRLSNVYGRYDISERIVPLFLYYARRNRNLVVFGREKELDFTFIDDCTNGLTRIIKRFDRVAGETLNLSTGKGCKLIKLARLIVNLTGSESRIVIGHKRLGEISSFVADISRARRLLGYSPKVSIEDGLVESLEWYSKLMKDRNMAGRQKRLLAKRGWA